MVYPHYDAFIYNNKLQLDYAHLQAPRRKADEDRQVEDAASFDSSVHASQSALMN